MTSQREGCLTSLKTPSPIFLHKCTVGLMNKENVDAFEGNWDVCHFSSQEEAEETPLAFLQNKENYWSAPQNKAGPEKEISIFSTEHWQVCKYWSLFLTLWTRYQSNVTCLVSPICMLISYFGISSMLLATVVCGSLNIFQMCLFSIDSFKVMLVLLWG